MRNLDIKVHPDGHLSFLSQSVLAGSGNLLDWGSVHFMHFTSASVKDTIRLYTVNPARCIIGLNEKQYKNFTIGMEVNLTTFAHKK